jgi:hypothetical protein
MKITYEFVWISRFKDAFHALVYKDGASFARLSEITKEEYGYYWIARKYPSGPIVSKGCENTLDDAKQAVEQVYETKD